VGGVFTTRLYDALFPLPVGRPHVLDWLSGDGGVLLHRRLFDPDSEMAMRV